MKARKKKGMLVLVLVMVLFDDALCQSDHDWMVDGDDMYAIPTGNVSIGTTIPYAEAKLHAVNLLRDYTAKALFGESRWGYGIFGKANEGQGIVGISGDGKDPRSRSLDDIIGVYGDANDYGVYGTSTNGTGGYFTSENGNAATFDGDVLIRGKVGIHEIDPYAFLNYTGTYGYVKFGGPKEGDIFRSHFNGSGEGAAVRATAGSTQLSAYLAYSCEEGDFAGYFFGNVYAGGNVGIGILNPTAKLQVDGDIKATGAEINGDLTITEAYKGNITSTSSNDGAPFPRPAFDSGWQQIKQGTFKTFIHDIGGNVDNYVVDLQFDGEAGISNAFYGTEYHTTPASSDYVSTMTNRGAYWCRLTTTQIEVYRAVMDSYANKVRVRIWVYR